MNAIFHRQLFVILILCIMYFGDAPVRANILDDIVPNADGVVCFKLKIGYCGVHTMKWNH